MKHVLFIILVIAATQAHGQCDQFDKLLKKGDAYLKSKKPNYQEAINAYTAAILACSNRANEAQKRIAGMVSDINRLKEDAVTEKKRADLARQFADSLYRVADTERRRAETAEGIARIEAENTQKALKDIEIQKARTDSALRKAEKLINAFYFHCDRFALAFRGGKFYFIDKNGDQVERLGEHDKAEQFDNRTGFARVRNEGEDYLLDTFGIKYKVAYSVAGLKKDITALDLRGNKLNGFPSEILQNIQLEVLIIDGGLNGSEEFPLNINRLVALKSLHLTNCQLTTLPGSLSELRNLQLLDLSNNYLTALPPGIEKLNKLYALIARDNRLTEIPDNIVELMELQDLDISNNQLTALPSEIGQLKNIVSLNLSENNLSELPKSTGQMQKIKSLRLYRNQLGTLADDIESLKNLEVLDLRLNQLNSLPEGVGRLHRLKSLDLLGNELRALPNEICLLRNLEYLNIYGNYLTSLPDRMTELKRIKTLDVSHNNLMSLPKNIENIKSLTEFRFTGNQNLVIKDSISSRFEQNLIEGIKVYDSFDELENRINKAPDTLFLLSFWATWCKPCVVDCQYLDSIYKKSPDSKIKILLISLDFKSQMKNRLIPFKQKHDIKSEVILLADQDANTWIPKVSWAWDGAIPFAVMKQKSTGYQNEHLGPFDTFDGLRKWINEAGK